MTEYLMVEIANQQQYRDGRHMDLTPRMEYVSPANGERFTNLNDFRAVLSANRAANEIVFNAEGQLMTASRKPVTSGGIAYHMVYRLREDGVEIIANAKGEATAPLQLIVPVIARNGDRVEQVDAQTVRVIRAKGTIIMHTDAADGFDAQFHEKTFNLVPGFEAFPFIAAMKAGKETRIRLQGEKVVP